jgi:hypothetical protein
LNSPQSRREFVTQTWLHAVISNVVLPEAIFEIVKKKDITKRNAQLSIFGNEGKRM